MDEALSLSQRRLLLSLFSGRGLVQLLLQRQTLLPGQLRPVLACQATAEPVPATAFMFKYTLAGEPPTSFLLRLPSAAVVQLCLRRSSRSITRATIHQTNKANGAWETLCLALCLQLGPEICWICWAFAMIRRLIDTRWVLWSAQSPL